MIDDDVDYRTRYFDLVRALEALGYRVIVGDFVRRDGSHSTVHVYSRIEVVKPDRKHRS